MQRWLFSWTGILGIKFPGVDPNDFLNAVQRNCRWLFSPAAAAVALAIVLYALMLVVGHFSQFRERLPELSALVDWRNLPWLLAAIGAVKVLHELAHALACKYFGGEVRELGLMLLVFAPCLYCDVSDAWRFPSKWRRIAVSAAGVMVELVLASVATIVWWYAQPGVLQLVALNVMVICTLNTLLVNGNPLMRYDGYYIFSDLVEVPNLWQRSREALGHFWSNWVMGRPQEEDPLLPAAQRPWLAAYAAVSKVYVSFICVAIVWGLAGGLAPYHLETLAYAVGLTVLGSALVAPTKNIVEFVRNPIRRGEMRKGRVALLAAVGLAAIVGLLSIPVDYNVSAPLVLMPEDASRVYATVEGTLENMLPAGTRVVRGEAIGRLANSEVAVEIAQLEGECQLKKLHVEHLERLRGVDREANDQLPTARTALADAERRLEERQEEAKKLVLRAPVDGVVIPGPRLAEQRGSANGKLATWSGSLLDEPMRGAHVEAGTLACLVGDPNKLTAVLLVDDADVKLLEPGQRARLRVEQLPGRIVEGEVVEVARHSADDGEQRGGVLRADMSPLMAGLVAPGHRGAHYEVRVRFDDVAMPALVIGGRGDAKVTAERVTVARRIWRSLTRAFQLPM
jgi:putative peptide zinc metalloprotease protein